MPRGDKSKYTDKEKRQADHIEEGYESRGVPEDEAERRAWATVNKVHGGGEKPGGGGYHKSQNHEPKGIQWMPFSFAPASRVTGSVTRLYDRGEAAALVVITTTPYEASGPYLFN